MALTRRGCAQIVQKTQSTTRERWPTSIDKWHESETSSEVHSNVKLLEPPSWMGEEIVLHASRRVRRRKKQIRANRRIQRGGRARPSSRVEEIDETTVSYESVLQGKRRGYSLRVEEDAEVLFLRAGDLDLIMTSNLLPVLK